MSLDALSPDPIVSDVTSILLFWQSTGLIWQSMMQITRFSSALYQLWLQNLRTWYFHLLIRSKLHRPLKSFVHPISLHKLQLLSVFNILKAGNISIEEMRPREWEFKVIMFLIGESSILSLEFKLEAPPGSWPLSPCYLPAMKMGLPSLDTMK